MSLHSYTCQQRQVHLFRCHQGDLSCFTCCLDVATLGICLKHLKTPCRTHNEHLKIVGAHGTPMVSMLQFMFLRLRSLLTNGYPPLILRSYQDSQHVSKHPPTIVSGWECLFFSGENPKNHPSHQQFISLPL